VDETRTVPKEMPDMRMCCAETIEARKRWIGTSDLRTSFLAIAADGTTWLTLYIYKCCPSSDAFRKGKMPIYYERMPLRSSWEIMYARTENGWMSQDLFVKVQWLYSLTDPNATMGLRLQKHYGTVIVI